MEFIIKTQKIRKKTKYRRESGILSGMVEKKFIQSDALDVDLYSGKEEMRL